VSPGSSGDAAQVNIPRLSSEQAQWLLSLIDGPGTEYEKLSGNVSWMLDSGASSHMVGDATLLEKVEQITPVAIGLPNGTYKMAKEQGSVALGQRIRVEKCFTHAKIKLQPCLYIKIM